MKKFICICITLCCLICFCGCKETPKQNTTIAPFIELNAVYDQNGNMLQQILYNENTKEYIMKEYTYSHQDGKWICIAQKTKIICQTELLAIGQPSSTVNIYYTQDLVDSSIVLLDNEDVKISIVEYLEKASWWEFGYKFKVENKSNKVITILFENTCIVNIDCQAMFQVDHIYANSTRYFNLAWSMDSLERCWVPYIGDVGFTLSVYNSENFDLPANYTMNVLIKN